MEFVKDDIVKIYERLADYESKEIFTKRLLFNLTNDWMYMGQIIRKIAPSESYQEAYNLIEQIEGKEVVYYGCGRNAIILRILFPDVQMQLMCDRDVNKQQNGYMGIKVLSPEELYPMEDVVIVVTSSMYHKEIVKELIEVGKVPQSRIIDLGAVLDDMNQLLYRIQYFENGIVAPIPDEIFVDGGCFNANTDFLFAEWTKGNYKKIYAFEPDGVNYEKCLCAIAENDLRDVEVIKAGVWSEDTTLSFVADRGQGSKVGDGADTVTIQARSIDSVVGDEKVTFIKLDVEGSELEALKGAKNTIVNNRPRLAICLYHKLEDIVEIPAYILSIVPDYKIYIRHYQLTENETIMYAV